MISSAAKNCPQLEKRLKKNVKNWSCFQNGVTPTILKVLENLTRGNATSNSDSAMELNKTMFNLLFKLLKRKHNFKKNINLSSRQIMTRMI